MAHPISKSSASKPVKNRKTTRFRTRSRTRSKRGQNEVQKLLGPHQSPKKAERTIFDTRSYRFHYCFVMVLVHVPHACKTQWAHHKHGLTSTCWICTKHCAHWVNVIILPTKIVHVKCKTQWAHHKTWCHFKLKHRIAGRGWTDPCASPARPCASTARRPATHHHHLHLHHRQQQ